MFMLTYLQGTNYDNRSQACGNANQYTKSSKHSTSHARTWIASDLRQDDSYCTINSECPDVEATVYYSTDSPAPSNRSSKTSSNSYTPYEITYRSTNSQVLHPIVLFPLQLRADNFVGKQIRQSHSACWPCVPLQQLW